MFTPKGPAVRKPPPRSEHMFERERFEFSLKGFEVF